MVYAGGLVLHSLRIETVPISELIAKGVVPDTTPLRPVVLVVDDEPNIADTIAAILNHIGFAATAAYSGETALHMALLIPPVLLLTDVVMPGMSGIELAIAVTKAISDCKALLFSGQAVTHDLLKDAKGHQFTLLQKPVHPKDLLAKMSNLGVIVPAEHMKSNDGERVMVGIKGGFPMPSKRGVGCLCKCGAAIWLWDTEMENDDELSELREWKRQDGWTRMVVHSRNGCDEGRVICADDLILLRAPAEDLRRGVGRDSQIAERRVQ